jgi:hypothetical protein
LPFQIDSGIQTSNSICESLVGVANAATRQKAGKFVIGFEEPGGVNNPLVMDCAVVIVVSSSVKLARSEQESAAANVVIDVTLTNTAKQNSQHVEDLRPPECLLSFIVASSVESLC